MSGIPITRIRADAEQEARIRKFVRTLKTLPNTNGDARIVRVSDAEALTEFFSLPEVSDPIYTIAKPVTLANVRAQIEERLEQQEKGEAILSASFDEGGRIVSYMDHQIWPIWSAVEFGGAIRPELQSKGRGRVGIAASIDWVFNELGVDLLCLTAAPDNIRSITVIDAMGTERKGEIDSVKPDGSTRRSIVWELTAKQWQSIRSANP